MIIKQEILSNDLSDEPVMFSITTYDSEKIALRVKFLESSDKDNAFMIDKSDIDSIVNFLEYLNRLKS